MPQPYNYSLKPSNIGGGFLSGMQAGQANKQARIAQIQQEKAQEQAISDKQEMESYLVDLSENLNVDNLNKAIIKYPQLAKSYENIMNSLSDKEKSAGLALAQKVFYAVGKGDDPKGIETATELLEEHAIAKENNGDKVGAKSLRDQAKMLKLNPKAVQTGGGLFLAQQMGPEKFTKAFSDIMGMESAIKSTEAGTELKKAQTAAIIPDQVISRRANELKAITLRAAANKLSTDDNKVVNDSARDSLASSKIARRAESLANKINKEVSSGKWASLASWTWKAIGWKDEEKLLRTEYNSIKASGVMAALPQGSASDADVALASSGFPDEFDNAEQLQSWLRGYAKIQAYSALENEIKAGWVSDNNGLGRAKKDMTIGGMKIPEGTEYVPFMNNLGDKMFPTGEDTVTKTAPSSDLTYSGSDLSSDSFGTSGNLSPPLEIDLVEDEKLPSVKRANSFLNQFGQ